MVEIEVLAVVVVVFDGDDDESALHGLQYSLSVLGTFVSQSVSILLSARTVDTIPTLSYLSHL